MNLKSLLCCFASALLVAACASEAPVSTPSPTASAGILQSGVYSQNFDRAVRPQDDFYRYVNGQWLTTTEIPADRSNYGAFSMLEDGAERDLRAILEEASAANAPTGADMQKVGDFYASFMDAATIEARGLAPLAGELASN